MEAHTILDLVESNVCMCGVCVEEEGSGASVSQVSEAVASEPAATTIY